MREELRPDRHLVVAGASVADVRAALSHARILLQQLHATPRGLFVEMQFADLATGTEHRLVAADGTFREFPNYEQSSRTAKWEARQLETIISELASGRTGHWSCEVAEGDLVTCACANAAEEDILLLCQRPMLGLRGSVLLLGALNPSSDTALIAAQALANAFSTTLSKVHLSEQIAGIYDEVNHSHVVAIVIDLDAGPAASEEDLRQLVSAARCPVVVIGAKLSSRRVASFEEGADNPTS